MRRWRNPLQRRATFSCLDAPSASGSGNPNDATDGGSGSEGPLTLENPRAELDRLSAEYRKRAEVQKEYDALGLNLGSESSS